MTLASQVGSKCGSRKTLEGFLVTAARSWPSSRKGRRGGGRWQDRWAGQMAGQAAWPGRKGPVPSRPQCKPGDGEQPAPAPCWPPSSCPRTGAGLRTLVPKTTPHGTPTTLPLGRGEPSRSRWLPRWWTGGRQLRGEGWWGQPRPGPLLDKPPSKASDPTLPSLNTA